LFAVAPLGTEASHARNERTMLGFSGSQNREVSMRSPLTVAVLLGLALAVSLPRARAQRPTPEQIAAWERDPEIVRDFEAGRTLRRAGKLEEAAAAYARVLQKAPGLAVAHLNLGLVRHDQRNYAASTREFSAAAELDPDLRQARLYLGIDAYLWGRYDTARRALAEAANMDADDAEALYWLGLAQAAAGDYRGAAGSLETATRLKPKDEDALYQLQEVYLELWKASYDRLVTANPDSFRIHQVLAEGHLQANRLDDAKREYALVLRASPNIGGVHEALGDIARQQRDLTGALQEYQAELALSPQSARVSYKIGDVLIETRDYAGAAKALRAAVALQENFAPAYVGLGRLARQEGQANEAIADFQKALRLGVKGDLEESAHYQLFRLLLAAGKTTEAESHKKQYLRLADARKQRALMVADRERKIEEAAPEPR
jgi:tetratricopeptide (TPR) repeat protein